MIYFNEKMKRIEKRIGDKVFVQIRNDWRSYTTVNGRYGIRQPRWLLVRENGAEVVIDASGVVHFIPNIIAVQFKNPDGTPEVDL